MQKLRKLLSHFSYMIEVKIVSADNDVIYMGKILSCVNSVDDWLIQKHCGIHDIVVWFMSANELFIKVDLFK